MEQLRHTAQEAGEAKAHSHFHEQLAAATALAAPPRSRMGRWLWRGSVGAVEEALSWTSEAVAAPNVLTWAKTEDPAVVSALVPGLYKLSAALFTASPAAEGLEILVDGAVAMRGGAGTGGFAKVAPQAVAEGVLSLPAGACVSVRLMVMAASGSRERRWAQAFLELSKM